MFKKICVYFLGVFFTAAFLAALVGLIPGDRNVSKISSGRYTHQNSVCNLPSPGEIVEKSRKFVPVTLKGLKLDRKNPLRFSFIVDSGNADDSVEEIKEKCEPLLKYFFAAITIAQSDLWVNLSPFESTRIMPKSLSETELGRDMLAQDYLLKQFTASAINPKDELGDEFWKRVYEKVYQEFGSREIPIETFNKVWVVPESAVVYEDGDAVYIVEGRLKVMTQEDYTAAAGSQGDVSAAGIYASMMKEVVIPAIEKEVNEGENFKLLRQIYHSLILAKWYEENVIDGFIVKNYKDQNKVRGVDVDDKSIKGKIYNQYVRAYKKGVFDFTIRDHDPISRGRVLRRYFSGGEDLRGILLAASGSEEQVASGASGKQYALDVLADVQSTSLDWDDLRNMVDYMKKGDYPFDLAQFEKDTDYIDGFLGELSPALIGARDIAVACLEDIDKYFVPWLYRLGYTYRGSIIRDKLFRLLKPDQAAEIQEVYDQMSVGSDDLERIASRAEGALAGFNGTVTVKPRVKSLRSFALKREEKEHTKDMPAGEFMKVIHDIYGLHVLLEPSDSAYDMDSVISAASRLFSLFDNEESFQLLRYYITYHEYLYVVLRYAYSGAAGEKIPFEIQIRIKSDLLEFNGITYVGYKDYRDERLLELIRNADIFDRIIFFRGLSDEEFHRTLFDFYKGRIDLERLIKEAGSGSKGLERKIRQKYAEGFRIVDSGEFIPIDGVKELTYLRDSKQYSLQRVADYERYQRSRRILKGNHDRWQESLRKRYDGDKKAAKKRHGRGSGAYKAIRQQLSDVYRKNEGELREAYSSKQEKLLVESIKYYKKVEFVQGNPQGGPQQGRVFGGVDWHDFSVSSIKRDHNVTSAPVRQPLNDENILEVLRPVIKKIKPVDGPFFSEREKQAGLP